MISFFVGRRDEKLIELYKPLGFDKVLFVKEISKVASVKECKGGEIYDAILIKTVNVDMLRRMVDKAANYYSLILVQGTNDKINRAALENKKVKALVSPEYNREKDSLHYRNSGLNQVLCKIARDNKKVIIEDFRDILLNKNEKRAILLGRIMQNTKLCERYNVRFRLGNFATKPEEARSFFDLRSFCIAVGASKKQAQRAFLPL
ncbi:MAG: hypothetical protein K6T16_01140 [Candidatus Pacearchaeota archaeon]|nr:hypothetical protein [Candidatus Pacearchaeota archaeon]